MTRKIVWGLTLLAVLVVGLVLWHPTLNPAGTCSITDSPKVLDHTENISGSVDGRVKDVGVDRGAIAP